MAKTGNALDQRDGHLLFRDHEGDVQFVYYWSEAWDLLDGDVFDENFEGWWSVVDLPGYMDYPCSGVATAEECVEFTRQWVREYAMEIAAGH